MNKTKAYNIDCMEYMQKLPDNAFDLAIVDPPYGIGEDGKKTKGREKYIVQKNGNKIFLPAKNYKVKDWDKSIPNDLYFSEVGRVSVNSVIFGANYFPLLMGNSHKPPRRNRYESYIKKHAKGFIIWDKVNGNSDQADCEVIYTTFNFPSFVMKYMWAGFNQGISIGSIYSQGNKKKNEDRIHPTQKPIKLYRWLLQNYAKEGDKILDTHLGSGSSRIAADEMGFEFVGCELDGDYFNDQEKRFNKYKSQTRLFETV